MRFFTRMIVCIATAMMLFAVVFSFVRSRLGDDAKLLRHCRSLLFETRRSQALLDRAKIVSQSMHIKREIIAQLLARRLHLREAIDQFQRANELIENEDLSLIPVFRMPTDRAGVARQVLAWATSEVDSWPEDRDKSIVAALEKEYRELFDGSEAQRSEGRSREPSAPQESDSVRGNGQIALMGHSSPRRGLC